MLAAAQDVALRSRDGAIELTGTLLGFDGQFYRIDTEFGELTVDGTGVNCDGTGCPSLVYYVAAVTISGSATLGRVLMPALIEASALCEGLASARSVVRDDTVLYTLAVRDTGKAVVRLTNAALAQGVLRDPFGIGMASYSDIGSTKPLVLAGACGFQLRAARRTIKTEDYPLVASLFLYQPARRLPALGWDFMAFAVSEAAQIVIRRAGFVD